MYYLLSNIFFNKILKFSNYLDIQEYVGPLVFIIKFIYMYYKWDNEKT